jgi:RNA polymerase sigma-70 factor (ECF subfamily)
VESGDTSGAGRRVITYCLVPRDVAAKLHEPLRKHFRDDPGIEVVVERRRDDRRSPGDRRDPERGDVAAERRRIRNLPGRRVGERRAALVPVEAAVELPRRLRALADRLVFVERLAPSDQQLEDIDTGRLVTRFQGGDDQAFGELYIRYFDHVYSYLRVLFREDPHEAEDLTQQVFTNVFEALPRYERRTRPFRAWLFTIVRNLAFTNFQRRSRSEPSDPAELRRRFEEPAEEADLSALEWITDRELVIFVERLPLAQRQVLVLRFMLDMTTSEIARVLERNPADVRKLEHRALRFLQQRLTALGRAPRRGSERHQWRQRVRALPVARMRRYALR